MFWLRTRARPLAFLAALRSHADAVRVNANQVLERFMERQRME